VAHLVWLLSGLVLRVDRGLAAHSAPPGSRRRRGLLWFAALAYALLASRLVWLWAGGAEGVIGFLGGNAYVWASIALLLVLPVPRRPAPAKRAPAGSAGCANRAGSSTVDLSAH
jgi:alpha-1,2-mannosyltransferase